MEATKEMYATPEASKAKDRTITLTVKSHDLYNLGSNPTSQQIDNETKLENDGGHTDGFGTDKTDFNTDVYLNKTVTWKIKSNDPDGIDKDYNVALVSITQDSGTNNDFFKKMPLTPKSDGTITGKVEKGTNNSEDHYTINFSVTNNNVDPPSTIQYNLDPQLKMKT